jgi:hypothetical protein
MLEALASLATICARRSPSTVLIVISSSPTPPTTRISDFMSVSTCHPCQCRSWCTVAIGAYDSVRVYERAGRERARRLYTTSTVYTKNRFRSIVKMAEYDVIHAYDWLTIQACINRQTTYLVCRLIVNMHATGI